ncbi:hypothetical protein [Hymenobacter sp. YC55]|uniref:hypothetical protein n=1 Tax=Hymenobacter sp. YC55 TaxID=3034019 RepID=UPI0023F68552|nr:hypothetical protein [Hymenobacter sp. YC55]MDF7815146.1 hypothetical protein [Hymenobacter sp. YC55]
MKGVLALFGGAGVGALIGVLTGLSISSTVAVVIGSLTSVLIVLLGLKETADAHYHALRTGAFGFACTGALLTGIYLRAHNALAPNIHNEVLRWTAHGEFSLEEAKRYVAYERLGIIPPEATLDTTRQSPHRSRRTVLFAATITLSDCTKLKGYENFSLQEEVEAYRRTGALWKSLAEGVVKHVPASEQQNTLHLTRKCLCND